MIIFSFFFQTENLLMDADKNIKIAGKYCPQIQLIVTDPGFPRRGRQLPRRVPTYCQFFTENCMKTKEFDPGAGGLDAPSLGPATN